MVTSSKKTAEEQADAMDVEQVRLLYAGLPAAIVINTLLALILAATQAALIGRRELFIWLSILLTILLARMILLAVWRRERVDSKNCVCWLHRFRVGVIATGLAWGLGAVLLFPAGDIDHQSYLAFALAGLSAGAISSLSVDRVSTLGFLLPMLLPLIVRFGLEGGKLAWSMSLMVMLFLVFIAMNAMRGRRSLHENFSLRIKAEEQERRLRQSEARLNQAQRTARIGNWELDLVSNKLYWSDEIYRIFGIDPARFEPSYAAFLEAIYPEDRDAVNSAYTRSLETREPYEITHRLKMSDGSIKWVIERCDSLFDAEGKPLSSIGTVQDITEQKRIEAEREWQIRNQQALLNAIQESTFLMEKNGTMLVINEVGAQRLKTTPEGLIGKNIYELLPPEVAQARKAKFEHIARTGMPETFEDERAGRHFLNTIYPIFDADGKVARFSVYADDVTQQRWAQGIEALFSDINQKVLAGVLQSDLLHFICSEVARLFVLDLIWLGRKEPDGVVSIMTYAGAAAGYVQGLKQLGVRWDDTPQGRGGTGTAIRSGHMQLLNPSTPGFQVWRELAHEYNFQSMMAIPLLIRGEVYGAFTLYSGKPDTFDSAAADLLLGISTRISVALEAAMDQQQIRLLSSALAAAGTGVMITSARGIIKWVNPAFAKLSGYSREELIGQTPRLLKSGQHSDEYYQTMWETISRGESWNRETVEQAKNGDLYTVSQTITPVLDEGGEITHFIAIYEDITEQKQTQKRIEYLAHFDALTGLPNRTLFYDRLEQALSLAKRNNGGVALLFMDLDGFKQVNDTMGHHAGDLLLIGVAERLRQCIRESDTVARLGGDEFTVILNDAHEQHSVARIAEKIIASLAQPFDLEGSAAKIGVSIGIARYSEEASTEDELVKNADQAMYAAKAAGKNTYRFGSTP
jgi:diguanylate cyclase (GGDEF)-like protein/PAS domain S-box-containing protein